MLCDWVICHGSGKLPCDNDSSGGIRRDLKKL